MLSGVAAAALRWINRRPPNCLPKLGCGGGGCAWCKGAGKLMLMTSVVDCDCRRARSPSGVVRFAVGERVQLKGHQNHCGGTVMRRIDGHAVTVRWDGADWHHLYSDSEFRLAPPRGRFSVGDRVRLTCWRYFGTVAVSGVGCVVVRWDGECAGRTHAESDLRHVTPELDDRKWY